MGALDESDERHEGADLGAYVSLDFSEGLHMGAVEGPEGSNGACDSVGVSLGPIEGKVSVGAKNGTLLGTIVGSNDGLRVGSWNAFIVGCEYGDCVGTEVGLKKGESRGCTIG